MQPIAIGTYCTICLLAAAAMLIMIPYSLDELVAMGQFLVLNTRRGRPFWRAFFRGDALPGGTVDKRPGFSDGWGRGDRFRFAGRDASVDPRGQRRAGRLADALKAGLGTEPPLADTDHLIGALVVTVSVIAMAEVGRPLRFLNIGFAAWLIASPWMIDGGSLAGTFSNQIVGLTILALSLPRGRRSQEHYGSWDRFIV
ncbi:SPW repeat domain-containing protein [Brevundimonas denitrificans]|uniref:SPW repeat domain-containing protein n=1 Tax=Brevundimonas denitrificans TaxID=1443434 RepID=UPI00352BFE70